MEPFLSTVFRGTLWGAFMGMGLGAMTGVVASNRGDGPPRALAYRHPATGRPLAVDAHGLNDDAVGLLHRVAEALAMEPSIRPAARKKFTGILDLVRRYYNALEAALAFPQCARLRIKARRLATKTAQAVRDFEPLVWDSPEIETIMTCLAAVQQAMVDRTLTLDR
jgi:hypothetical protein